MSKPHASGVGGDSQENGPKPCGVRSKHVKLKEYGPGPCVQQEGMARGGVGTPRALQAAPSSQSPLISRSHPGGLAPKGPEQASPLPAQPYLLGPTKGPTCHALPHGPDAHTNHDNSPVCAKASNLPKASQVSLLQGPGRPDQSPPRYVWTPFPQCQASGQKPQKPGPLTLAL